LVETAHDRIVAEVESRTNGRRITPLAMLVSRSHFLGHQKATHLGRKHKTFARNPRQRFTQAHFALAVPVERGSIEEIHAQRQGTMHHGVSLLVWNISVQPSDDRTA